MKYLISFIGCIVIAAIIVVGTQRIPRASVDAQETPVAVVSAAQEVTVQEVAAAQTVFIDVLGTVHAIDEATIMPAANGSVKRVRVKTGDYVHAGDVMFELTGAGNTTHIAQTQHAIAQTQYDSAMRNLELVMQANQENIHAAQVQVASVRDQSRAAAIDVQNADNTVLATVNNVALLDNTLRVTQYRNDIEYQKQLDAIDALDRQLRDAQRNQEQDTEELRDDIRDADGAARDDLEDRLDTVKRTSNGQINTLEEQITAAQRSLDSLAASAQTSENQILNQLQQAQSQIATLQNSQQSSYLRSGLAANPAYPVQAAESALNATVVRNDTALAAAQAQAEIARLNLTAAATQESLLSVAAPIDGIVDEILVNTGDMVTMATPLTRIINPQQFEIRVPVDTDTAARIAMDQPAEVSFGSITVHAAVATVAPAADPVSRFVTVTLALPQMFAWEHDHVSVRLPVHTSAPGDTTQSFFVPLDAVTIGTQETFLYIRDDEGRARKVSVELGIVQGDYAEIVSGVSVGDEVIVEGARGLIEGDPVTVR